MNVEDLLTKASQGDNTAKIDIGNKVESMLKSDFGAILKALTAGRSALELQRNLTGTLSADRVLGRIEMANQLWGDLEQFVLDKDALLRDVPQEKEVDSYVASEPIPRV